MTAVEIVQCVARMNKHAANTRAWVRAVKNEYSSESMRDHFVGLAPEDATWAAHEARRLLRLTGELGDEE